MALPFLSLPANAQEASLAPIPQAVEVMQGDTFEISYQVDPANQPLAVADMHLQFDPEYLEVLDVEALSGSSFNVMMPAFDNGAGRIDISAFQLGEELPQEAFELVKVTFLALNETAFTQAFHPNPAFPRTILAFAGSELESYTPPLDVTIQASDPLSTENMDAAGLSLNLWPNPTHEKGFATMSSVEGGEVTLTLFDLTGKVVAQYFHGDLLPGVEQVVELDLHEFSAGVYLCQLTTTQGTLTKRLALTR